MPTIWMKKWEIVHSPLQQTQHSIFYPSQMFGFSIDPKESVTTQGYSVRVECYWDLISILKDEGKVTARRGVFHTIVSVEQYLKSCLWGAVLPNSVVIPGFKSQFCYYLLRWPWASDLASLCLNFSILKCNNTHVHYLTRLLKCLTEFCYRKCSEKCLMCSSCSVHGTIIISVVGQHGHSERCSFSGGTRITWFLLVQFLLVFLSFGVPILWQLKEISRGRFPWGKAVEYLFDNRISEKVCMD